MKGRVIALIATVLTGTLLPVVACALPLDQLTATAHRCCHPSMAQCGDSRTSAATCCTDAPHPALIPTEAKLASPLPPPAALAMLVAAVAADPSSHAFAVIFAALSPPSAAPPGAAVLRI